MLSLLTVTAWLIAVYVLLILPQWKQKMYLEKLRRSLLEPARVNPLEPEQQKIMDSFLKALSEFRNE